MTAPAGSYTEIETLIRARYPLIHVLSWEEGRVREEIERKLMRLPTFDKQSRRLQRLMVGHATEIEMDGHGRILLSRELREYAQLDRQAMLIGQGTKFELWDDERWKETRASWIDGDDNADLSAELASLSL